MKLLIADYLSRVRESGELDVLVPDVVSQMGLELISRPQRGARQSGVDFAAVGVLPSTTKMKLYLFVLKRGDIGRTDWNNGNQAVRPTLDEVIDTYLPHRIAQEHRQYPVCIVVCCGGGLLQTVTENWTAYTQRAASNHDVEFSLWNGDKLAGFIERYLLDESLFPDEERRLLRKTLALIDVNDYDNRHFYQLIERQFAQAFKRPGDADATIRRIHLCLQIVIKWADSEGNIRQAYLCAERVLLRAWELGKQANAIQGHRPVMVELARILETLGRLCDQYLRKLAPFLVVQDGLSVGIRNSVEYPIKTFEVLGILSVGGLLANNLSALSHEPEAHIQKGKEFGAAVSHLINNNPSALTPLFDSHMIEIGLLLLLLENLKEDDAIRWYLNQAVHRVTFGMRSKSNFPVDTDQFDNLVELQFGRVEASELLTMSTLLPLLADWCAFYDMTDEYEHLIQSLSLLPEVTLQQWHPDDTTEEHLFSTNAAYRSGVVEAPIRLPATIEEHLDRLSRLQRHVRLKQPLSCIQSSLWLIACIASRHYRTPLLPFLWQDRETRGTGRCPDNAES